MPNKFTKEKELDLTRRIPSSTSLMHTVFKRASPKLREFVVLFIEPSGVVIEVMSAAGMPQAQIDEYKVLLNGFASSGLVVKLKERYLVHQEFLFKAIGLSDNKVADDKKTVLLETKTDPIHDARKWLRHYLQVAIKERASDVHFCVRKTSSSVMIRINGDVEKTETLSHAVVHGNLSALYSSDHDPRSNSHESFSAMKDCSCTMTIDEMSCKLRWQTVSRGQSDEYDVVFRVIMTGADSKPLPLQKIGFTLSQEIEFNMMATKPDGLVVLSGVTGSGKSTTLQSVMGVARGNGERKIYSLEDPIEKIIYGVTQVQIQREVGDAHGSPFANKIVSLMRADPDVIMIGELRDAETANACIDGVRTGHLIFTTVHAPDAMQIIGRLASPSMRVEMETLATPGILSLLVYQRLLQYLCPHCKKPLLESEDHTKNESMMYHLTSQDRYSLNPETIFVKGDGCQHCKKGIAGQTVCAEMIRPNDSILQAVMDRDFIRAKREWRITRTANFDDQNHTGKTAMEMALYKVSAGLIDPYTVVGAFGDLGLHDIIPI